MVREPGDELLIDDAIVRYQPLIRRAVGKYLGDPGDIEDAIQETYIKVMTGLGGFNRASKASTWIYAIAKNAALDLMRKNARTRAEGLDEDIEGREGAVDDSIAEAELGYAQALMSELSEDERRAVVLGLVLGFDSAAAGAALQVTPACYRKRLSRAAAKLESFRLAHCDECGCDFDSRNADNEAMLRRMEALSAVKAELRAMPPDEIRELFSR